MPRPPRVAAIQQRLALWSVVQNAWYGLSLGSVLLLAAIGPCHHLWRDGRHQHGAWRNGDDRRLCHLRGAADHPHHFPGLFDYSLLIAVPLAFIVAGAIGIVIERTIIRFLYGRPLETLLATWGLSLVLQQAVRTMFGPTNQEVGNPSWMSGAFQLGQISITYNRLWILCFTMAVFVDPAGDAALHRARARDAAR